MCHQYLIALFSNYISNYLQVEITLKDSTDEGEAVKHFLHTKGKEAIREKLKQYVSSLKEGRFFLSSNLLYHLMYLIHLCSIFTYINSIFIESEFTVGMILPKKDNVKENISTITSGFNAKVNIHSV